MTEKTSYAKRTNILEEYIIKKYGSINNFLGRLEKLSGREYERKNIENILKNSDFLETMQLGMKVCGGLKIDFVELFANENICVSDSAGDLDTEEAAEEKYSLLNPAARQKTLEYINDILKN